MIRIVEVCFIVIFSIALSCKSNVHELTDAECKRAIYFDGFIKGDSVYDRNLSSFPQFPGGKKKLIEYLISKTIYPGEAKSNGIIGRVYYYFIVKKNGDLCCITKNEEIGLLGFGCEEEGLRVLKSMPKWKPAKIKGESVNSKYSMPINFGLAY